MPNIILKCFMLFNSSEGLQESQEGDKLLFHWAHDDQEPSLAQRINDICLCDASVNIGQQLSKQSGQTSDLPNRAKRKSILTFEHTLVVAIEMESEQSIWMAIHVAPPGHLANCIPAAAIELVLTNIYDRFCLLNGTFQMIAQDLEDRRAIREKMRTVCDQYFSQVLPEIHLNSIISNVASLYNAIVYIDLNPITLMKINSFINHLVSLNANQIQHTILIFNDQLLWSSLDLKNTRLLYNYMVSVLIRQALQEELSKEVDEVRKIKESLPLYLEQDNSISRRMSYMTVFRSRNNMTLGLLIDRPDRIELIQKCEQILTTDSRLGVIPLASLAQSVGQKFLKANTSQSGHNSNPSSPASDYIFMNNLDGSISWPLNLDMLNKEHLIVDIEGGGGGGGAGGSESQPKKMRLIKYLIDLEPTLKEMENITGSQVEEFFGKTLSDSWFTITNSRYRTIYAMHHFRNSSLCEARQSTIKMKSQLIKNRL